MPILIGTSISSGHKDEFEAGLGRPCDALRWFAASSSPPNGSGWQQALAWSHEANAARTNSPAGYAMCISVNPQQSYASVAAGGEDARWTAIGDIFAQFGVPAFFGFKHEVENDSPLPNAAEFRAAARRCYSIVKSRDPRTMNGQIYLGGFQGNQFEGRNPPDWWAGSDVLDFVGVDYYDWRGGPSQAPNAPPWANNNRIRDVNDIEILGGAMNSWMEFATSVGKPIAFPEIAASITPPGMTVWNGGPDSGQAVLRPGAAGRALWFQEWSNRWRDDPRILFVTHFELNGGEPGAVMHRRISGGLNGLEVASMAAFRSIGDGGSPPPPPPPPPPPVGDFLPGVVPIATQLKVA